MLPIHIDPILAMMLTAKQRRCLQAESEWGLAPRWFEDWQECEPLDESFDSWAEHARKMADGVDEGESGDLISADDAAGGAGNDNINGGGGAPDDGNDDAQLLLGLIPSE